MLVAAKSPPSIPTLILLTGLATLSLNMFLPSLSNMAQEFQVVYGLMSLSVAGYLGIMAVLQLIIGPLSDRFGRRPVMLMALALFLFASIVCMLATDVWVFLVFRVLQGVIIAGWSISLAAIRDTVPERQAASLISYISMAMAVAPMLGPILGGVLDEGFGWRANFMAYTALGLVALSVCWLDFGETNTIRSDTFLKQFRAYPALLKSQLFWGYALCTAFSTSAFYAFLAGAPLVAEVVFAISPASLGFYIGTITAGFMLGSFLSGRYSLRVSLSTMMLTGRVLACTGLVVGLVLFWTEVIDTKVFFGATLFVGIGNGLTLPSSNTGALSAHPQLAGSAAGLLGALTVAFGAGLTSITSALLTEDNAAYALLSIMLLGSALGLVAALFVHQQGQEK